MSKHRPPTAQELIAATAAREKQRLESERREAELVRKGLLKQVEKAEHELAIALQITAAKKPMRPLWTPRKGRYLSKDKRVASAHAVASDWHVGEIVKPETVSGLNEFNPEIARTRAARFFEGIAWLILEQRSMFAIHDLDLDLLGDFISGHIHAELVLTNAMTPIEESMFVQDLIEQGIRFLLATVPDLRIRVPCLHGNHDRTTQKTWVGSLARMSHTWQMYHSLRKTFLSEPRVQFQVAEGAHMTVEVYGWRKHMHHGDSVKSQGGIGGVDVPLNRAAGRWREKYDAHWSEVGHFHQIQIGRQVVRNGSLIGYSTYAEWLAAAAAEDPMQAFYLVDAKRGMTQGAPLWVKE